MCTTHHTPFVVLLSPRPPPAGNSPKSTFLAFSLDVFSSWKISRSQKGVPWILCCHFSVLAAVELGVVGFVALLDWCVTLS